MTTVTVSASKTYKITIGKNILSSCGDIISGLKRGARAAVITDDTVAALYSGTVKSSLSLSGIDSECYIFPHGEISKNPSVYIDILNFLCERGFARNDIIVALGGGVVGDMAGFAAATYMRGIDFVQIPTTLLAAVDSSVGGKTGMDLEGGKNLAGAFHQPLAVICDTDTFSTLPEKYYTDGVAESIKYGVISDRGLFEKIENGGLEDNIESIVARCVQIKADIVSSDEFDTGKRAVLNFGHTVGHAIEKLSGYGLTHGHAVAAGMAVITRCSEKSGFSEEKISDRLEKLLRRYGLPTKTDFTAARIAPLISKDKKRSGNEISFILAKTLGDAVIVKKDMSDAESFINLGLQD